MKIALGSVQFGLNYGISNSKGITSKKEVKDILSCAIENGINTIDTAIDYGNSELVLGESDLSKFKIITKIPNLNPNVKNISKWVEEKIYSSMSRLNIESFYGVLIHNSSNFIGNRGKNLIQTLHSLKKEGIIKKTGISIYDPSEIENLQNLKMIDLIQAPLNLIDRRMEKSGWINRINKEGIEFHARSIFLQDLLLLNSKVLPIKFKQWKPMLDRWYDELKKKELNALSECLSYPMSINGIDKIIVGVNNVKQLNEIVEATKLTLEKREWSFMKSDDKHLINPYNWKKL